MESPATAPPTATPAGAPGASAERRLLRALRQGDEAAFAALVARHHAGLKRVARAYVRTDAVAEEVVQETWLGVLEGLDRFEGRSSVKTWTFRILANRARTRAVREGRSVPFSSLPGGDVAEAPEPSVDPARMQGEDRCWPGHWSAPPRPWEEPERRLLSLEVRERVSAAIERLPANQRVVVTLRDVEGLSSEEVCELLGIGEGNQRVILHRGRSRVRSELEGYLDPPAP